MAKATTAEIRKAILKELPKDGSAVGNQSLRQRIAERLGANVKEEDYFEARNALIEDGDLETGRGRGGSVRRAVQTSETVPVEPELAAKPARERQVASAEAESTDKGNASAALASLWFDVGPSAIAPPMVTREQVLPLGSLTWENFERLCFRLAHRGGDVEDARIYGVRGQAQEGIDLYVRRATGEYATWQCKCYQDVTATDLRDAVTKFLEGEWARRTKLFRLAVAPSLNATQLAEEIEKQQARCRAKNIIFEPLDRDKLSLMLKEHPDLVDDFFGRSWVEAFNGHEAAASLHGRKLTREQKLEARRFILTLYSTHFQTVDGGIPAAATNFRGAVKPLPVFDRYIEPSIELVESIVERGQSSISASAGNRDGKNEGATERASYESAESVFRKREIRTKMTLSLGLAASDRFLLLGGAGFGKSAALRVVVHSLLNNDTRFPDLAKSWGQRLPLLLPFGFLTRQFAEDEAATIESALKAWLKMLGAKNEVLMLLEEMLTDDRLLLLVDGLDEWHNREAAATALTALIAYAQTRRLPLIATGRPLGFERIGDFGFDWKRAELLPLSTDQQREFATCWFRHFHETAGALDTAAVDLAVARHAGEFSNDLSEDSALSELGGIPLLLSTLIYLRLTGRALPHSRLAALDELVKALLEDQPRHRAQAAMQRADQSAIRSPRIRRGIEYLAYRIHQEPNSVVLTNDRAMDLLRDYFRSGFELTYSEAEEWATRVMELGQQEFGVLVTPQEHHVGLVHRIFQEYLAAKYLARLSLDRVRAYCIETGCKAPWHEVTLTLMQLLERQDDVDGLIEELRRPASDHLDEPLQQILLTRLAVADTNCSRRKACELVMQIFSWIECGRWMPLRRSLVRELAAGLQSEHVSELVKSRMTRWFPGRVRFLHRVPAIAVMKPTPETVSDLRIALHNCDSSWDYRYIAEALASCADKVPELAEEFLEILKGPTEPELLGGALHALATGWPMHPDLPSLLDAASVAPAKELRRVAIITRFKRGERTAEIRDALVGFCREGEWPWPWEKDIVAALVAGWPNDPDLKRAAIERIKGIGFPGSWATKPAIHYLLQGCPGDDDVAKMLATQLALDDRYRRNFTISDVHEELLAGFTKHPLLIPAAEAWFEKNASAHDRIEVAVMAQLGGTPKCRQSLLDWLSRGEIWPAWIISTLLKISEPGDPEVQAALTEYMSNERRRVEAVRWIDSVVHDPKELGVALRIAVRDGHVFDSCSAIAVLVEREGRDTPDLWSLVEARITNDKGGHYWRLGHDTLLRIWPEQPLIRQLAKSTIYAEDTSLPALYEAYGEDSEIRPMLDRTMQVLHDDLRLELARAIEPLARRGVEPAVAIVAEFIDEPNGDARTVAARAYARGCLRIGRSTQELTVVLNSELGATLIGGEGRQQAAIAALLDLGRADHVVLQREDGSSIDLSTYSNSRHNWEFISAVVEHWDALASAVPDIWARFQHSPIIATELAKAGKGGYALDQTAVYEDAVRTGKQLEVEQVRALIALHGRSTLLKDLFLARLQHFLPGGQQSMMVVERAAYNEMASYVSDHFHGDVTVGNVMISVAQSGMIRDVGLVALCRGWPDSAPIAAAIANLPALIDADEPVTAWLFASKADAALMKSYLLRYPAKLRKSYFSEPRDGIEAVLNRLQADRDCRELVVAELHTVIEVDTRVALAKLLAPSLRTDPAFRSWMSDQLRCVREHSGVICPLAFDTIANAVRPVEFTLLEAALTRH